MDTLTGPAMAAAYAARGWPVIPLHSPERGGCDCRTDCGKNAAKHPRTIHGVLDATNQADTVARWWRMWPGANIGIATGAASGLVVLDVDPRSGGDHSLARLLAQHGGLPETPCVRTGGGGLHYYFAHPGRAVKNSAGKLGRGVDVRGDGGYIVAPPSIHISGERYVWATACAPAALPDWLIDHTDHTATGTRASQVSMENAFAGFAEGERDDRLYRLACKLRRVDMPRDVAQDIVLRAAAACIPPFPVLDRETGLVWQRAPSISAGHWDAARQYCATVNTGGRNGWRLPTTAEFLSLRDESIATDPQLPSGNPFVMSQTGTGWWTSTENLSNPADADAVSLGPNSQLLASPEKANSALSAWCVRGPTSRQ